MGEHCTCGAVLVEDALFCHKCGKPQRDILPEEPEPIRAAPEPPPLPVQPARAIGFHNALAVRIALVAGILSIVLSALTGQVAAALGPLWLIAGGFWAVFVYRRRTGQRLTPMNGAHLGWICGVFNFVIVAIMMAILVMALSNSAAVETVRDQWRQHGRPEADLNQLLTAIRNPLNVLAAMPLFFLLFTVLPAFGGAIGAKLLDRRN
ncbi:MAG TPA: hypothetical protein VKX39_16645 [Bryobacteraceae bacterium]|nr:hypothetical protein [Bryobacteraceae bacterium]